VPVPGPIFNGLLVGARGVDVGERQKTTPTTPQQIKSVLTDVTARNSYELKNLAMKNPIR
jgi:hypothetical protein